MMFEGLLLTRSALVRDQAEGLTLLLANTLFLATGMYALSDHLAAFLAAVAGVSR